MSTREGRGPRTLTLVLVTSVLLSLIPIPAAATHSTDLAYSPPTGWSATIAGTTCPTSLACDGSDSTGVRTDDTCFTATPVTARGAHYYCTTVVAFTRTSGVTTFEINAFRALHLTCQTGAGSSCGGATLDMVSVVVTELISGTCGTPQTELYYGSQSAGAVYDTGEVSLTTPVTIANNEGICIWFETVTQNTTQWGTTSTVEVYADVIGPTEVNITEYIYNLRAYHPPFIRRYSWAWVAEPVWVGTWTFTDSDDTVLASGDRPGFHYEQVDIQCPVVCGDDTYLITVNDETNNQVAYYTIDGDADGQLIDDVLPPRLVGVTGFCYQATSAQCDAVITTVGVVKVTYTFTGTAGYSYDISAGQMLSTASLPSHGGGVSGTHEPGSYTLYIPAASMDTDGPPYAVLLITAKTGGRAYSVSPLLNFDDGGTVTTIEPPEDDSVPTTCAQFDIVCGLRSIFNVGTSAVRAAFQLAYEGLISRQPFAFLFGSAASAVSQVQRAQAAVTSSDDCAGVHFTMPTLPPVQYHAFGADKTAMPQYYAYNGTVPSPTPFVFSAVRCEDIEPWGGSEWWQGLRTIMGPALVMGYAFQLFRRYEVKPQLGG